MKEQMELESSDSMGAERSVKHPEGSQTFRWAELLEQVEAVNPLDEHLERVEQVQQVDLSIQLSKLSKLVP